MFRARIERSEVYILVRGHDSPMETGHARLIRCLLHEQTKLQIAESRFIQVGFQFLNLPLLTKKILKGVLVSLCLVLKTLIFNSGLTKNKIAYPCIGSSRRMHACSRVRNIKIRVGKRTFFVFKLRRRQLNATMGPNWIATHCLISSRKGLSTSL